MKPGDRVYTLKYNLIPHPLTCSTSPTSPPPAPASTTSPSTGARGVAKVEGPPAVPSACPPCAALAGSTPRAAGDLVLLHLNSNRFCWIVPEPLTAAARWAVREVRGGGGRVPRSVGRVHDGRGAAVVRVRAPSRRRSSTVRSTLGRGRWEVSWRTSCSAMYGGVRIEPTLRPRGRPGAFWHGAECAIAVEVDYGGGAGPDSAMENGHQQVLMRASRWPALALPWWRDLNSRVQS
nr:uncharacterized protein LOC127330946 [Lolium perenne]